MFLVKSWIRYIRNEIFLWNIFSTCKKKYEKKNTHTRKEVEKFIIVALKFADRNFVSLVILEFQIILEINYILPAYCETNRYYDYL